MRVSVRLLSLVFTFFCVCSAIAICLYVSIHFSTIGADALAKRYILTSSAHATLQAEKLLNDTYDRLHSANQRFPELAFGIYDKLFTNTRYYNWCRDTLMSLQYEAKWIYAFSSFAMDNGEYMDVGLNDYTADGYGYWIRETLYYPNETEPDNPELRLSHGYESDYTNITLRYDYGITTDDYDHRTRPWYVNLPRIPNMILATQPYMTLNPRNLSIDITQILASSDQMVGVISVTLPIGYLNDFLRSLRATKGSLALFVNKADNSILGSSNGDDFMINSTGEERHTLNTYPVAVVREIHSKLSLNNAESIKVPSGVFYGIISDIYTPIEKVQWKFMMVVPQSDFMSEITRGQNIAIGISAGLWFVLMVLAALFSYSMTRPLILLGQDLECVSRMELDDYDLKTRSLFKEVAKLQDSFEEMVHYLKEYRKFLPSYVLTPEVVINEETNQAPLANPIRRSGSGRSTNSSRLTAITNFTKDLHRKKSHHTMKADQKSEMRGPSRFDMYLSPRLISVLSIHQVGFMDMSLEDEEQSAMEMIDQVMPIIKENSGVIHQYGSGWVIATWNAVGNVAGFETKACKVALQVLSKLPATTYCTICTSRSGVGNVGNSMTRTFTLEYRAQMHAEMMRRLASNIGVRLLIDQRTHLHCSYHYKCRFVDMAAFFPDNKPSPLYECQVEVKTNEADCEWMYQLKNDNPVDEYSKATALLLRNDYKSASKLFESYANEHPNDNIAKRVSKLVAIMSTNTPYTSKVDCGTIFHPGNNDFKVQEDV